MKTGTVFLVGAGPGDPALLTEQGKACLKQADVVVYDALACSSVLNLTRPDCELIFAGKTAGNHHKKQSETNQLLAELAKQGKRVVRLKGGDPFVFGRGGEEAQVLQSLGIPFQIVSGVSSCYSVPAYAGIPVTHREYAPAFHVITGHRKTEQHTELDYATLAKLDGTLVFLMSLSNLPAIAASLIQQGTTARQRVVTAPLSEIAAEVQRQGIHTPAMTVIGDVVSLRQQLSWFGMGELSGKKVLLTGTPAYTRKAAEQLRSCGAEPVEVSLIYPKASSPDVLKALPWQSYTWAVLTSANGVEQLFASLKQSHVDLRRLLHLRFAAIGNGTAQALAEYGIFVDCVPEYFNSRSLAEALIPQLTMQDRVLLLRAENGSVILPQLLEQEFAGLHVAVCANLPYYITTPILMHLLESGANIDSITVMVQKEVAEKLQAPVGTRNSGAITAAVNYYGTVEMLFTVPRDSFLPPPNVDSAVIRIDVQKRYADQTRDPQHFFSMLKHGFSQRRKTLVNALSATMHYEKPVLLEVLHAMELPETVRMENLTMEQLVELSNRLSGATAEKV